MQDATPGGARGVAGLLKVETGASRKTAPKPGPGRSPHIKPPSCISWVPSSSDSEATSGLGATVQGGGRTPCWPRPSREQTTGTRYQIIYTVTLALEDISLQGGPQACGDAPQRKARVQGRAPGPRSKGSKWMEGTRPHLTPCSVWGVLLSIKMLPSSS